MYSCSQTFIAFLPLFRSRVNVFFSEIYLMRIQCSVLKGKISHAIYAWICFSYEYQNYSTSTEIFDIQNATNSSAASVVFHINLVN